MIERGSIRRDGATGDRIDRRNVFPIEVGDGEPTTVTTVEFFFSAPPVAEKVATRQTKIGGRATDGRTTLRRAGGDIYPSLPFFHPPPNSETK
jgi:hypothetical protein